MSRCARNWDQFRGHGDKVEHYDGGVGLDNTVVLGADTMQATWREMADRGLVPKASVVKVAHHGAASGHDDTAWSQLASGAPDGDGPLAMLTPHRRGRADEPSPDRVAWMLGNARAVFTTEASSAYPKGMVPGIYDIEEKRYLEDVYSDTISTPVPGVCILRMPRTGSPTVTVQGAARQLTNGSAVRDE